MLASPHSTPFTLLYPHPSVPSPVTPFNLLHPQSPSFILLHPSPLNPHPLSPYVTLLHPPSSSSFTDHPSPLTPHSSLLSPTLFHFSPSFTLHSSPTFTHHPSFSFKIFQTPTPPPHQSEPSVHFFFFHFLLLKPSRRVPTYRTFINFVGSLLEQSHHSLLTSFAHSLNQTVLGFHSHSILLKRLLVSVDQFSAAGVANP